VTDFNEEDLMADASVVHLGENSPEYVAYKLLLHVADAEKKHFAGLHPTADRKWILDTYAECLDTVQNPGARGRA
jgi:hypothetical protein